MNNNLFALARYLRDRNVEVDLFVPDGLQEHFLPENDTYSPLPDWVHNVNWGVTAKSIYLCKTEYARVLDKYDFLIGHTYAPAICRMLGRKLDIFIPHGADLYALPFSPSNSFWRSSRSERIARLQRKGIQKARMIIINTRAPVYKLALQKLGMTSIGMSLPALYEKEYERENIRRHASMLKYYSEFLKLREQNDIVVFSQTRHLWTKVIDSADVGKGNDRLIEGFARFCRMSVSRAVLILFEHGPDVERSKRLIAELGIEGRVAWMPIMPRKEIMPGLALADLAADQFVSGTFGGAGHEALAMGKPLLVYLNTADGEDRDINIPPCINVQSVEGICDALLQYEQDAGRYWALGQAAKNWFVRFRGNGLADGIIFLMAGLIEGKSASELAESVYSYLRNEHNPVNNRTEQLLPT